MTWLLGLFCSVIVYYLADYKTPSYIPYVEYYVIFLCLLGCAGFFVKSSKVECTAETKKIFWIVFGLTLIVRLIMLDTFSTWLDEEYQLSYAFRQPFKSDQHQPPLEAIFNNAMLRWFGYEIHWLRLLPAIMSAFGSAMLSLIFSRFTKHKILIYSMIALYVFHPLVVHFSVECRPISSGMFAMLGIYLQYLILLDRTDSIGFKDLYPLFSYTLLALLLLGMQPPFFILSLFLFTFVGTSFNTKTKFKIAATFAVTVILFLPIQYVVIKYSPPRLPGQLESIVDRIKDLGWKDYRFFYDFYLFYVKEMIILVLIFFGLNKSWPQKAEFKINSGKSALGLMGIFLFTFLTFFKVMIEYNLNNYYILIAYPLLLVVILQFLNQAYRSVKVMKGLVIFTTVFMVGNYYFNYHAVTHKKSDYKGVYQRINQIQGKVLVHSVCLNKPNRYCHGGSIGARFYLEKGTGRFIYSGMNEANPLYDFNSIAKNENASFDYYAILLDNYWSDFHDIPPGTEDITGYVETAIFYYAKLVILKKINGVVPDVSTLFRIWLEHYQKQGVFICSLSANLAILEQYQNPSEAQRLWQEIAEKCPKGSAGFTIDPARFSEQ